MKPTHKKSPLRLLASLVLAGSALLPLNLFAGTIIGSFPQLNGGYEGETVQTVPTVSSIATGAQSTSWSVNTAGTGAISPVTGRSGPYCVTNYSATAARRLQSPTAASGAITASTAYIVQFYYRTASSTAATTVQGGVSATGTGSPTYSTAATEPGTSGAWAKFTTTVSTPTAAAAYGIGIVRFSGASTVPIDVDDFVIYAGSTVDTTAPDPVTAPAVSGPGSGSLTVSWTAPGTGVDGGGYVVVRGTTDPTVAPNVNGIYAVGNTVAAGETVAYIGTTPSFTDSGLNASTTYYYRVYTVDKAFNYSTSAGASGTTTAAATPPSIASVSPGSYATNAGGSATFTVTLAAGDSPLSYYWFAETATSTNLIPSATTTNLTLSNVTGANQANYQVIVSNITGTATSSIVSLTVVDPYIVTQPASQTGLVQGPAEFSVVAAGSALTYKWYDFDGSSVYTPVANGTLTSGAVVSGATTPLLTITNLTYADPTNFVVVITGTYGSITSSVVTLSVANTAPLAFWNFNDPNFATNSPAPYQGIGTASFLNISTFVQTAADGNDPASPNTAWGTSTYPAQGTLNTNAGVRFNVSTVGAKNITVAYDARGTATATKYHRLQYTTNGTDFINYPASSSITVASSYRSFSYSLVGFPGVANNPNFGIRLVAEYEDTARYGNTNDPDYVGITSTYGTSGTLSFDLVTIGGDAITNANTPPTISSIPAQSVIDTVGGTVNFTVGSAETPVGSLTGTAVSLDPTVSVGLSVNNLGGGTCQLSISSGLGNTVAVNVPILVTITDGNGDSTVTSFMLTITPANAAPTITGLVAATNILANSSVSVPFSISDYPNPVSSLTVSAVSGNSTLVPNDSAHIAISEVSSNVTLTITAATNQLGTAPINVIVGNGTLSTTQSLILVVRPNTNVVLVDNFNYDSGGAIITASGGFWQTHSGTAGQLQTASGVATIDGVNHTEDVNAGFIGQPYLTNSGTVLYSSYIVNYTTLPTLTGAYFGHFKDNTTFGFVARVWASTYNAAAGDYRIGISDSASTSTNAPQFPMDLMLNSNYVVVTRLVLSNDVSTVWINPSSESSFSVTDTGGIAASNLVNIYSYALRESDSNEGIVNVSHLRIGTSFDAVVPSLQSQIIGTSEVLSWSDPTLGIQSTTNLFSPFMDVVGATSPYTNNISTNSALFFRFGQ